jgi:hydroxymethylglutaryl-CoA reductase (NADPH)
MKSEEVLRQLLSGTLSLHQLESLQKPEAAAETRRRYLELNTGVALSSLNPLPFGADQVLGKNIENLTGSVAIPLGIAGPLLVKGDYAKGSYYVPIATTEGALVASINRGCKLLRQSGGVSVSLKVAGISRAPLFETEDLAAANSLREWALKHESDLKQQAESTSRHLTWQGMDFQQAGRLVWVRMRFDSSEAMGMNMATIAAQAVAELICKNTGVALLAVSGNLCVDKKANYQNVVSGRGYSIQAEARIPAGLVREVLNVDHQKVSRVATAKNWYGGALSGSIGANAQAANVVAAVFYATGQDGGHIVNSATCFTVVEANQEELYVSVSLPSILVGSVGGGTGLTQQKTVIELMTTDIETKSSPSSRSRCLAEILAGAVMAGELSLLGALSADQLTSAHVKLGRAKK